MKKCPHCGKQIELKDNIWRPFCSERCKMVDLGNWFLERYAIPDKNEDGEQDATKNIQGKDNSPEK